MSRFASIPAIGPWVAPAKGSCRRPFDGVFSGFSRPVGAFSFWPYNICWRGPIRTSRAICLILLAAVPAAADQSTYVPVSRSGSSQLTQGQPAAAGTPQFQTPAGARPMSAQEMLTQAKDRLPTDQFEAFEKALKKIDPAQPIFSEPVIDGSNIPLQIIFKNGQATVIGMPAAPAPVAQAPAEGENPPPPIPASAASAAALAGVPPVSIPLAVPAPAPAAAAPVAQPEQRTPAAAAPPAKFKAIGPPAPQAPAPKYPPPPPASSALGFPQPGKAAINE
ncbi:MAG TPA: hypothetical protein VM598_11130 [Bdellovibrionota bacterium]|nr:hypothetical protein [Bdellovibrionota bacterium]